MPTQAFTPDAVNLFLGTTPAAQTGTINIRMKTNKYYTDGSLKSTGNIYTVTKAWGDTAIAQGWASQVVSGSAILPEKMNPAYKTLVVYTGTWANRPSASAVNVGDRIMLTDFGYAQFYSDGAYYRPVNGGVLLYQAGASLLASPIATLTGNGTVQYFILPTNALVPAGMLFPGVVIEIGMVAQKFGTHTGNIRAGLATSNAGANFVSTISVASNASAGSFVLGTTGLKISANDVFTTGNLSISGGGTATTSSTITDAALANNYTADRYVVFGIGTSYTDSAANLVDYYVRLRG